MAAPEPEVAAPSAADARAAQKRRNTVLALTLIGFVVLVFLITVVQLRGGVLQRPL